MGWLYRYSIRHPIPVMIIAGLVTLGVAPGMLRLKLRTDGHALVPTDAPEIQVDRAIRSDFNTEDPIVVLIRTDDHNGIFNTHTLSLVQELTSAFQALDDVRAADVFSLATEHNDRVKPGTLIFRRFLDPLPETDTELKRLRNDLKAIRLYNGTLVSYDEKATSIMVGVPSRVGRTRMYGRINDIIAAVGPVPEQIHVIGAPVAEALLGTHILEDLGVPTSILGHRTFIPAYDKDLPITDDGSGAPSLLYSVRMFIARHVGLVPIALLIMAIVFFVSFRSIAATALPLMEVGACLVFVFGLMGWLDVPVYLTIAVLPIILSAIGIADEIHVFARYRELLRERPSDDESSVVEATLDEMWVPVVKTSLTTAIGFLSFTLSPIGPVRAFGFFTSIGILFCMFWSLSVIPAMLVALQRRRFYRPRAYAAAKVPGASYARLAEGVLRYRWIVIVLALGIAAAAPFGVRQITVQDSWIDGFAPESEFYRATELFNEQFLGTHILLVRVTTPHEWLSGELAGRYIDSFSVSLPGDLIDDPSDLVNRRIRLRRTRDPTADGRPQSVRPGRDRWHAWIESAHRQAGRIIVETPRRYGAAQMTLRPYEDEMIAFEVETQPLVTPETLGRIDALDTFLESQRDCAVGGVLGTADYLATANFMSRARDEKHRKVPDEISRIEWVWSQYERIRGPERRKQVVNEDYTESLVTVFLKDANFVDTQRLMDRLRAYEQEHLAPYGIRLSLGGDVAVSQTLIGAIVSTQVVSVLLSLAGILLVTSIMGRSLLWGVLCVLPCSLAVLLNFATMGLVGMPLGVATSMFAGMTLGIGVDYAIHLLERCRLASSEGATRRMAIVNAVRITGPAIVIDAVAIAFGFGVMTLSQVPANARLGGLVVLSIIGCLAATLLLLPALLGVMPDRRALETPPHQPS